MLKEEDKAPDFKLEATDGKIISLKDFIGKKKIVLYFYPKDNTPGCTKEACSFNDNLENFNSKGTVIIGISPDSIESHKKFTEKHNLNILLLSDAEHKVAELYGAWGEKNMYGKKYMGIIRSTFIIDKKGAIKKIYKKVRVAGHTEDVLENID